MTDSDVARVAPATVDDIGSVTDLWIALAEGQQQHGSTLLAEENRTAVREWVARSVVTGELLVARSRDGVDDEGDDDGGDGGAADTVGFVGFALDHGGYDRDRTRGTVSNLFVVPGRRGEGIGSALLAAAERALCEAGAETVTLEALASNDRALEFYVAHGYDRHRVELTKSLSAEQTAVSGTEAGEENDGTE